MVEPPIIMWFRNDLRLADNAALSAAVASGRAVIPVYVDSSQEAGEWAAGSASRWWLGRSLEAIHLDLVASGSRLLIRRGSATVELVRLVQEAGARAVFCNRCYEPGVDKLDLGLVTELGRIGVEFRSFGGGMLFEPEAIVTREGKPFQVFTPFWKACLAQLNEVEPSPAPKRMAAPVRWPAGLTVGELGCDPTPDWAGGMRAAWTPGEGGARRRLQEYVDRGLARYDVDRNRPDLPGCSRLSPHLHFGEVSPRQVVHACRRAVAKHPQWSASAECYIREIGWREFAYHLLHHFPYTVEGPLRREFERFPWITNTEHVRAWQRGRTGYPIVDAGMRELWTTGWMHNRVRMIVASFLVKDLLIDWREGATWFWDTLVDADLANNTLGWQWTAGCGADAAPYFRVFNPVLQGRKFDPEGMYVRRWVPELAALPGEYIHEPWNAPPMILAAANVKIGQTYPAPIIDHSAARTRALAAFEKIKAGRSS